MVAEQRALVEQLGADAMRVVATAAIRGAANAGRVRRRDARRRRRRRRGARRRGGGAAGLPAAPRARSASRSTAASAWSTSAAARPSSRSARCAGGATWSESFRVGSGLLDRRLPALGPAVGRRAARDARARRRRRSRASRCPPVDAAVAVGGSAASLRRLVGAVLDAESLQRAMRVLAGDAGDEVARALRDRPRARASAARRADRARRRGARARPAAADRPRRFTRGRPARARGAVGIDPL